MAEALCDAPRRGCEVTDDGSVAEGAAAVRGGGVCEEGGRESSCRAPANASAAGSPTAGGGPVDRLGLLTAVACKNSLSMLASDTAAAGQSGGGEWPSGGGNASTSVPTPKRQRAASRSSVRGAVRACCVRASWCV
jgi:hypothetical protein